MASHIQLNAANIGKSSLMFGQLVSADSLEAHQAAATVIDHLNRTTEARDVSVVVLASGG